jgi:hypothetical protein
MTDRTETHQARTGVLVLAAPEGRAIRVHLFPGDGHLARDVRLAWTRLVPDRADAETFRRDLEAGLRAWYPLLSIHRQDQLAAVEADDQVWYIFRDGTLRLTKPWRNALHTALAEARDTRTTVEKTILQSIDTLVAAQRYGNRRRPRMADAALEGDPPAAAESETPSRRS